MDLRFEKVVTLILNSLEELMGFSVKLEVYTTKWKQSPLSNPR